MPIILNIAAIAFGFMAFLHGPAEPKRMFAFGALAAILFVSAMSMFGPTKNYGVECNRYGFFASDC